MPYCKECGKRLPADAKFCPYCGAEVAAEEEVSERAKQKPTAAWYLVPFFFGIIGGIIGYFAVKDDDKGMANNLLIFGFVWTFLLAIIIFAFFLAILTAQPSLCNNIF